MNTEETYFLTMEDIVDLHADLIVHFGGLHGIRDQGLLESAAAQPQMQVFGKVLHPTLFDQAAAYLYHLTCNHAFQDGNKRIGLHACLTFLEMNGAIVSKDQEPWYQFTLSVANGSETKQSCLNFIREHCV